VDLTTPSFEIRILLASLPLVFFAVLNLFAFHARRSGWFRREDEDALEAAIIRFTSLHHIKFLAPSLLLLWKEKLVFSNLFLLFISFGAFWVTLTPRPVILRSSPVLFSSMHSGEQTIEIEFSSPVDKETINLNISPQVEGRWELVEPFPNSPLVWRVRFYPEETFYPGVRVAAYVAGLRSWLGEGKLHEDGIIFFSPDVPHLETVTPNADGEQVPIDSDVELHYDSSLGEFVRLEYLVEPETDFVVIAKGTNAHFLQFEDPLAQNQTYRIRAYMTLRSYDVFSNADLEIGETTLIKDWTFTTVAAPGVSFYEPKGNGVRTDIPIRVVFDESMDKASVEENFSISPGVVGNISWEDEKTFVFSPERDLKKGEKYRLLFGEGTRSVHGGVLEDDLELVFKTVGRVLVSRFSPLSGSSQVSPKETNIAIWFNQRVDQRSAQNEFSLSPSVAGRFRWEGNKMIYQTLGNLKYDTRYTVHVGAGVRSVYGLDSSKDFTSTFTTRPRTFTLGVPYYSQHEQFTCNLAAMRMALAYRGIYRTESEIRLGIGVGSNPDEDWVDGYGVHADPVAEYVRSQGRNAVVKRGWSLAELVKEIEGGNPVVLFWYNRYSQPPGSFTLPGGYTGYNGMHSEVVRGFVGDSSDPDYLLTNDPWRGALTYSRAHFLSTWAYLNYTAIVVY
jgi:uncharacterized protein YvpB